MVQFLPATIVSAWESNSERPEKDSCLAGALNAFPIAEIIEFLEIRSDELRDLIIVSGGFSLYTRRRKVLM